MATRWLRSKVSAIAATALVILGVLAAGVPSAAACGNGIPVVERSCCCPETEAQPETRVQAACCCLAKEAPAEPAPEPALQQQTRADGAGLLPALALFAVVRLPAPPRIPRRFSAPVPEPSVTLVSLHTSLRC